MEVRKRADGTLETFGDTPYLVTQAQTRAIAAMSAELRGMLAGTVQFHVDPMAGAPSAPSAPSGHAGYVCKRAPSATKPCWVRVQAPSHGWDVGDVRSTPPRPDDAHNWRPCSKDGWVAHGPQPNSECQAPQGVRFEVLLRGGEVLRGDRDASYLRCIAYWRLGLHGDRAPMSADIAAWRPLP